MTDTLGILTEEPAQPKRGLTPSGMGYSLRMPPEIEPLRKPMADFKPHPRNLRKHNLDAIAGSLDEYGQQIPIVVQRSTGYICKGNGTYKAARLLGATEIAASVEDFDDDTAWRYLLADNRASDLADYDRLLTIEALEELVAGDRGLDGTLWNVDALEDMKAQAGQIRLHEPDHINAAYAVDEAMLARREAAAVGPGVKMKETSLVMTVADHERFMSNIGILRKVYGTGGVIATVVEAVRREAARQLEADGQVATDSGIVEVATGEIVEPVEPPDEDVSEEDLLARLQS